MVAIAAPALSQGSTIYGADLTQSLAGSDCANCSMVAVTSAAGTPYPGSPVTGVITSLRLKAMGTGQSGFIQLLRPSGATGPPFTDITDIPFTYATAGGAGQINEALNLHVPIRAADHLGVKFPVAAAVTANGAPRDCVYQPAPGVSQGDTAAFGGAGCNNNEPLVQATIEPDADGDGFGDETQDECPTDPSTQGACQADLSVAKSADRTVADVGDSVSYAIRVNNNSAYNAASGVMLTDALPAGMTLVSAAGGSCNVTTCALGDLPKGATATVTIVARAAAPGNQTDTASASSSTPDNNLTNNSASASTLVRPPFRGLSLKALTRKVAKGGKVQLPLTCPAAAVGNCIGTDTLATAFKVKLKTASSKKARVLILGRRRFSIAPGRTANITIKLSKKALKLLSSKHRVKARQTVVSHDSRNVPRTTSGRVTLKKK